MHVDRNIDTLVERVARLAQLSEAEKQEIRGWPTHFVKLRSNSVLARAGEARDHLSFVAQGILGHRMEGVPGTFQISAISLPGELTDLSIVVQPTATYTLVALSDAAVLQIPLHAVRATVERSGAVTRALWRYRELDDVILEQWLVSAGRRDAKAAIAHLLCEIAVRMAETAGKMPRLVPFPLTQQSIGDALALTSVHTSRMITSLRAERLADVRKGEFEILDWDGLVAAALFDPAYLRI